MNFTAFSSLALVLLSLGLAGCGGPTVDASSQYKLTFTQSGGIAGVDEVTTIDTAARTIGFQVDRSTKVVTASLTGHDLASLADAVEASDLTSGGGPYKCAGCADQFSYAAQLELDGSKYDVEWEDDSDAPEGLVKLGGAIQSLDAQKFPEPAQH
jgi:Emfourin